MQGHPALGASRAPLQEPTSKCTHLDCSGDWALLGREGAQRRAGSCYTGKGDLSCPLLQPALGELAGQARRQQNTTTSNPRGRDLESDTRVKSKANVLGHQSDQRA